MNMRIRYNNIYVDINDPRFIFRLILSLQHGKAELKLMRLFCTKTINKPIFKNFVLENF